MDQSTHIVGTKKIWRVGGGLVGVAGDIAAMLQFIRWIKCGSDEDDWPKFNGCFHAMCVSPTGKISLFEDSGPESCEMHGSYCAIGSGSDFALGALACKQTARAAVRAAIKHHAQCKPPIRSYKLRGYEP